MSIIKFKNFACRKLEGTNKNCSSNISTEIKTKKLFRPKIFF